MTESKTYTLYRSLGLYSSEEYDAQFAFAKEELQEAWPECRELGRTKESDVWEYMNEMDALNYECELENMAHIPVSNKVLGVGSVGKWNGKCRRAMIFNVKTVAGIMESYSMNSQYELEWYVSSGGELCQSVVHHDGANNYIYRVFKDDVNQEELDDLRRMLAASQGDTEKFANTLAKVLQRTRPLGIDVAAYYGWHDVKGVTKQRQPIAG